MRGRRPKERKSYVLRTKEGTVVEVNREIYLEWYQSRRRERYQSERKQRYGGASLEEMQEKGEFPISAKDSLEDAVIRKLCIEKLYAVMEELEEKDAYLLYLLFFEEATIKEAAQLCGCSRKTVSNRKKRILKELNEKMKKLGIMGGAF